MSIHRIGKAIIVHEVCKYLKLKDLAALNVVLNIGTDLYKSLRYAKINHGRDIVNQLYAYCKGLTRVKLNRDLVGDESRTLSMLPIKELTSEYNYVLIHLFRNLQYLNASISVDEILSIDTPIDHVEMTMVRRYIVSIYDIFERAKKISCDIDDSPNDFIIERGLKLQDYLDIEERMGRKLPIVKLTCEDISEGILSFASKHTTITDLSLTNDDSVHMFDPDISCLSNLPLHRLYLCEVNLPASFNNNKLEHLFISIEDGKFPKIQLPNLRSLHLDNVSINLHYLKDMPIVDLTLDNCTCKYSKLPDLPLRELTIHYPNNTTHPLELRRLSRFKLYSLTLFGDTTMSDDDIKYLPQTLHSLSLKCDIECEAPFPPKINKFHIESSRLKHQGVANICKLPLIKLDIFMTEITKKIKKCVDKLHLRRGKVRILRISDLDSFTDDDA